MGALGFLWHLANLFAVSLLFGLTAATGAKLIWRHALAGAGWLRLVAWVTASGVAVTLAGLLIFGRDGRMVTYGLMVVAGAAALGWAGFRKRA